MQNMYFTFSIFKVTIFPNISIKYLYNVRNKKNFGHPPLKKKLKQYNNINTSTYYINSD